MNIQLKPGLWKTRDGRKAVVEFRTECPGITLCKWFGYVGGEFHRWDDVGNSVCPGPNSEFDIISPWTEPKLRPWKPEEVPVGALFRKGKPSNTSHCWMIVGWNRVGFFTSNEQFECIGFNEAMEDFHSLDGGKTWKPCGVMEGEA